MRGKRIGLVVMAGVVSVAAGGCVDRAVSRDVTTFSFSWWVPLTVLLGAAAALPAGLLLRRRVARLGWGLLIGAPVLALVAFPSTMLDKVKVDAEHFEARYGLWFAPSTPSVRFGDLSEIRLVTYTQRTRRGGRRQKQKLVCTHRDAAPRDTIPLDDLLREAAPEILRRAGERRVVITEEVQ